jgi:ParB-like chromosome segregation protein Spo0J
LLSQTVTSTGAAEHLAEGQRRFPSSRLGEVRLERVPLDQLDLAGSVRVAGVDEGHVRTLLETADELPPIVVHEQTMRVIDGVHRVHAALRRGATSIVATFFDGTLDAALVLAVELNSRHGLPLSLDDRKAAAARILLMNPDWSDVAVARAVGLSDKTVAAIRDRSFDLGKSEVEHRVGVDGVSRPMRSAEGRERAAELFINNPGAKLREVAAAAGIGLATAKDVRDRLRRGADPVPPGVRRAQSRRLAAVPRQRVLEQESVRTGSVLQALRSDPSLRFTEAGRAVLRMLEVSSLRTGQWEQIVDAVPSHCAEAVARVSRECAEAWTTFAQQLEAKADTARMRRA